MVIRNLRTCPSSARTTLNARPSSVRTAASYLARLSQRERKCVTEHGFPQRIDARQLTTFEELTHVRAERVQLHPKRLRSLLVRAPRVRHEHLGDLAKLRGQLPFERALLDGLTEAVAR